ncbi:alanine racemase [Neisseria animalis]|uniref:Alanine racemase n=1 Tax=Neisseria animalis TaxID=492 RepID=A0A5P3MRE2_NEIAN|nr:alanine racemase [Neisseria animalis]QEY23351.1 alanine racemase [Neisseria animalis]ROW33199.1 alanine racemase [Neisseria animalis]VEE08742.1 alanine racemase [Neisseria animalis]
MRPLNARIRLDNLRHNYQTLKAVHGGRLLAVVKANAYGHGAVRCAHALADLADGFAVATLDEAVELRESGIGQPIVLLEGVFEAEEYAVVDKYRLWPAVCSQWQLEALIAHDWQQPVDVWLKMDSGMHRAGFFPHHYAAAFTALKQCRNVGKIVKFSHFACADEPENGMTEMQLEAFDLACEDLPGEESLANSAAILNVPEARRDWGRAGIALYGISPFGGVDERLKPVMRLTTRIFGERVLQPHSPVGYGATFYTSKSTRIGLIACGYADGYPRRASTNSPVAVEGIRSRVIGRVSMDMMMVELDAAQDGLGCEVELWGDTVNANEVADAAGTIAYELLCNVKRAKFTYSE